MKKLTVYVKVGKSECKVMEKDKGLEVWVKASPVENKANVEVIEVLADYLKVSKSSLSIKSGRSSRHKIVLLAEI